MTRLATSSRALAIDPAARRFSRARLSRSRARRRAAPSRADARRPLCAQRECGLSASAAASTAALFDVGGVAGGVAAGLLTDRVLDGRMVATAASMAVPAAACCVAYGAVALREAAAGAAAAASGGSASASRLNLAVMLLLGFFIAGPDGVLGGAVSRNLAE